ncbi:uncharacterized protein [Eurosta solidaginis]|uniref:uncharacterized protein n=1 Tax=Eurosta solidaginis TaxID=178769 RepID=UPI003530D167
MSNAVKTRDSALHAIKRYMTKAADESLTMYAENVKSYLQLLNEQWVRFNTAQDAVEISCGTESIELEENNRIQAEAWYTTALSSLNLMRKCREEVQSTPAVTMTVSAALCLPKMELPTFSRNSTEWMGFFDAFSSLVDRNTALTAGQKLHYLRSCLKGDALKIINGFQICDANYEEAWELLKTRYKVMRVIMEGHLRAMSSVKKVACDSGESIKGVIDTFQQHIRELKALGRPVEFWDDWLVYKVVNQLAFETRNQWELSLVSDDPPTFENLVSFLEVRCRSLSMLPSTTTSIPIKAKANTVGKSANVFQAMPNQKSVECAHCKGPHEVYSCEKFRNLDSSAKSKFVMESGFCTNCLSPDHYKAKCNSLSGCRVCHQRHHTLLHHTTSTPNAAAAVTTAHFTASQLNTATADSSKSRASALTSSSSNSVDNPQIQKEKTVLLATALVKVRDCSGSWQSARLLFDSGSHASFVTEACVQRLGLPRKASSVVVRGIGSSQGGRSRGEVLLSLSSYCSNLCFSVNALILPKITSELPTQSVAVTSWSHVQGLFLADPHFMDQGRIDMLICMDVMDLLLYPEFLKGPPGTPMAQRTVFGWTLFGFVDEFEPATTCLQALHCDVQLDKALTRLWELEEGPQKHHHTAEERQCEEIFERTHRRASDGRFIVELPLRSNIPLGDSREFALRSLLRIERRLARDDDLRLRYNEFMQELIDMNHMEAAKESTHQCFYMPHHPVVKESSVTTKLRVVFNASAKTTNGNSLNDALLVGPQLQQDLFSILTRFRTHRYAVTADVAKMYRQVRVSEDHIDLQRIVWRQDPCLPVQDFRMLRVTYGVAAAPHLAVKALQETANQSAIDCPKAVSVILKDFYMDDLLTGTSLKHDLLILQKNVTDILKELCRIQQ